MKNLWQKYERSFYQDDPTPHEIESTYGDLGITGTDKIPLHLMRDHAVENFLTDLHAALIGLHEHGTAARRMMQNAPAYVDERITKFEVKKTLRDPRLAPLEITKAYREEKMKQLAGMDDLIIATASPPPINDRSPAEELQMQERRSILNEMQGDERTATIASALKNGDPSWLKACHPQEDPRKMIDPHVWHDLAAAYAFSVHDGLADAIEDVGQALAVITEYGKSANGAATRMLMDQALPDPNRFKDQLEVFGMDGKRQDIVNEIILKQAREDAAEAKALSQLGYHVEGGNPDE